MNSNGIECDVVDLLNTNKNNTNEDHVALVMVAPSLKGNDDYGRKEEQEFMAIMTRLLFRNGEDRRRFEEYFIRSIDDLRMLDSSELLLLFPEPRDVVIQRRLTFIIKYLQMYRKKMETIHSLQMKNMTMSKIIAMVEDPSQADPAFHPKGWCGMSQESELILRFLFILLFSNLWFKYIKWSGCPCFH